MCESFVLINNSEIVESRWYSP